MNPRTIFDKIWDAHVVEAGDGRPDLVYVDLHLVHEVTSPQAFRGLELAGRSVRRPDLTLATVDHAVPTVGRDRPWTDELAAVQVESLRESTRRWKIPLWDIDDRKQGIVHVVGPEQGLTQPGMVIVCGDSHTSTHGAFGALAFGVGTSEVEHVLATQTLRLRRPKTMAVEIDGELPEGTCAKDVALLVMNALAGDGGRGYALEFRGSFVRRLDMEERMTLCNMSIEAGARSGLVAPDDVTFDYLEGRSYAPKGQAWRAAVERWRALATDAGARWNQSIGLSVAGLSPRVTWGTTPAQNVAITDRVPDPEKAADERTRAQQRRALAYMDLAPGIAMQDVKIDRVFIGSCTNARISDLRAAARVVAGKRVAAHVSAMVVPGSGLVKEQAEREGLDRLFKDAGLQWRDPGCSMCLGMNGDVLAAGERCASTSNRNFEGRQGAGGRTHLVGPAMAAAAAIAGHLVDVREVSQ